MSSTKKQAHTPGPWVIKQRINGGWFLITANDAVIAGVCGMKNALLASTAPELMESLIYLRDCAETGEFPTRERWWQVQAVIKKATGEAA